MKNNSIKTKVLKFTVVFERAREGGYIARVPALPGCLTQGETLEEAEQMAHDAIRAYCASLKKHKEPVPAEVEEIVETLSVTIPA
jgi:antitoxin HicB